MDYTLKFTFKLTSNLHNSRQEKRYTRSDHNIVGFTMYFMLNKT